MSGADQIKAYVQRVLRLKEEQDTIGADIRDVYAEAKSQGFDKTVLGKVVDYARKMEKKGRSAVEEQDAIFETYLRAYLGTPVATHTHASEAGAHSEGGVGVTVVDREDEDGHRLKVTVSPEIAEILARGEADPSTPELVEDEEQPETAPKSGREGTVYASLAAQAADGSAARDAREALVNDEPSPEAGPQAEASPAGTGAGTLAGREGRHEGEAASVGLPTNPPSPATSSRQATVAGETSPPVSPAASSKPDCLKPETCEFHFTSALCWTCNDALMKAKTRGEAA